MSETTHQRDLLTEGRQPWTACDGFRRYAVRDVASVEAFCRRYYKADRLAARGAEYVASVVASKRATLHCDGVCIISHHDSVTGETVAFYGPAQS